MKFALRMFGLFVAFAGLVAASIAPTTTQKLTTRHLMTATDPGPMGLPAPLPCQLAGTCFVPGTTNR